MPKIYVFFNNIFLVDLIQYVIMITLVESFYFSFAHLARDTLVCILFFKHTKPVPALNWGLYPLLKTLLSLISPWLPPLPLEIRSVFTF